MQSGSPAEWAAGVVNASRSLVGAQLGDLPASRLLLRVQGTGQQSCGYCRTSCMLAACLGKSRSMHLTRLLEL